MPRGLLKGGKWLGVQRVTVLSLPGTPIL